MHYNTFLIKLYSMLFVPCKLYEFFIWRIISITPVLYNPKHHFMRKLCTLVLLLFYLILWYRIGRKLISKEVNSSLWSRVNPAMAIVFSYLFFEYIIIYFNLFQNKDNTEYFKTPLSLIRIFYVGHGTAACIHVFFENSTFPTVL